jgi:CRP-like cAMP-binding protein
MSYGPDFTKPMWVG